MWPAASVNALVAPMPVVGDGGDPVFDADGRPMKIRPTEWLDRYRHVEQMTWAPGEPLVVHNRLVSDGGWIERLGCATVNLYRPPTLRPGDPLRAGPWLDHIERVYPDDGAHIIAWLAQRVQRPQEKLNHALVLGGLQGIGKDSLLEPVKVAIGPWNFVDVSPTHLLGRFNGFAKAVVLRINEARDLGDIDRFAFYDHMKIYTAAPPDVLRVDEKNLREYAAFNVCGVVITSNHKTVGLYLPADDRRHYVAWSERTSDHFAPGYWRRLYDWFAKGGVGHVAAYLANYDLSMFDPKAPPPKTPAFWDIVDANRAPEDAELADVLDKLGDPAATTLAELTSRATAPFAEWLRDRRNSRHVPHRLEAAGYAPMRNPDARDGLWRVDGRRAAVYVRRELTVRDRLAAARELVVGCRADR
jgi:hypothetical protein